MIASGQLQIDLSDRADIRAKLPKARALHMAMRRELEELEAQVSYWGELVDLLAKVVGEESATATVSVAAPPRPGKIAPGQDRAVRALERFGRPIGPARLFEYMVAEHLETPKNANALGANLWAAERSGRAKKVEGLYAPLSWEPLEATTTDNMSSTASDLNDHGGSDQASPNGVRQRVEDQEPSLETGT